MVWSAGNSALARQPQHPRRGLIFGRLCRRTNIKCSLQRAGTAGCFTLSPSAESLTVSFIFRLRLVLAWILILKTAQMNQISAAK